MKTALMSRGQCNDVSKWKQDLSKAQVIQMDLSDIYFSITQLSSGEELNSVKKLWDQVIIE